MKLSQKVAEVIESGIVPIVLKYEPIEYFVQGQDVTRTYLVVNSLDIGILEPQQYRFVAARCKQGQSLVRCHVTKLLRQITKEYEQQKKPTCYTLPVYARNMRDGSLCSILFEGFTNFPQVQPAQVCIEISADVLYEDIDWLSTEIGKLRELSVKIAVSEIGDAYCPMFRLAGLTLDYAFLDPYAKELATSDNAEDTVKWLVEYLHARGANVIAPAATQAEQNALQALGCDGYTVPAPELEPARTLAVEDLQEPGEIEPAQELAEQEPQEPSEIEPAQELAEQEPQEPSENEPAQELAEQEPQEQIAPELEPEEVVSE